MTRLLLVALLLGGCSKAVPPTTPRPAAGPVKHVVLVTVDGLLPETYLNPDAHALQIPTLRRLVREGAYGTAQSVFPSVTYPAHTTIATGVRPERHGIRNNRVLDPLDKNLEGWQWYAQDITAPTLWDVAGRAGLRTALISWPVTVGARASWLVPEYWRARQPDDLKLLKALSTPGLLDGVASAVPDLEARLLPPQDSALVDIAAQLIANEKPELLLLHTFQVDEAQHHDGLWSPAATQAIENADAQLARLLSALERAGIAQQTALLVASDHGFASVSRQYHPAALLREAGLITLDDKGKPSSYRAWVTVNGGEAYVYLHEGEAADVEQVVRSLFEARAGQAGSGIGRVFDRAQIHALGGDPRALLALEAEPGSYFGSSLGSYASTGASLGMHGYDPERPEMQASLLWLAPGVKPGLRTGARLIDIAPTVAQWLGLTLPESEGRALD